MKLTFLGTGAADWPIRKPAQAAEFRRLSSLLIDDTLLIDPGPQVMEALTELGKDPTAIRFLLNTHPHRDHYSPETRSALEALGAVFHPLTEGDTVSIGPYTVQAFRANHGTSTNALHFLIRDGERTLFYGLDGAWLLYDEVQAIKSSCPDLAVFDGTVGEREGDYRIFEHNNLAMVRQMKATLSPYIKRFFISHMARTLHTDHETLCESMRPYGIGDACDGLEIEL